MRGRERKTNGQADRQRKINRNKETEKDGVSKRQRKSE